MNQSTVENLGDSASDTNAFEQAIAEYFAMWVRRDFSRFDKLFSLGCVYEELRSGIRGYQRAAPLD